MKKLDKTLVDVKTIKDLTMNQRFALIGQMIVKGHSKQECIEFIMNNFFHPSGEGYDYTGAYTVYRQSFAFIYQQSLMDKEDMRKLNMERLEQIYDEAIDSGARITDKLKTIDLMNKTMNLYTLDVNINNGDNTFKFDLNLSGSDNKPVDDKPVE